MQRNIYIDIVKGVAIILVVLGHCIQYGTMYYINDNYFCNPIFVIIYSFHMPLFMLISGYLFYGSISRHPFKHNLKTRFTNLLMPIIAWNSINLLIVDTHSLIKGNAVSFLSNAQSYFTATWFLWSIFWCSLIVLAVNKFLKDNIVAYMSFGIVLLFLPNVLGIPYHAFMYPYFVAGHLWNKYKIYKRYSDWSSTKKLSILSIVVMLFTFLCTQFNKTDYVYTSGTCIVGSVQGFLIDHKQLNIDIFRYIVGFAGSTAVFLIVRLLYNYTSAKTNRIVAAIGRKSIGIYVISVPFINSYVLSRMPYRGYIGLGGGIVETVFIVAITYFLTTIIEKNTITKKLLLGSR